MSFETNTKRRGLTRELLTVVGEGDDLAGVFGLGQWETELLGASIVNIHSKVIVLDPFGDNPVGMIGSHNLGFKASSANDDNLLIVGATEHLRLLTRSTSSPSSTRIAGTATPRQTARYPTVWHGLEDSDQWQNDYLTGSKLAEIGFWLGVPSAPTRRTSGVRSASSA